MKKITSVAVILVLISTSVFASPVSAEIKTEQKETVNEVDLFAYVQATALTGQEMEATEGEGWFNAIVSRVIGSSGAGGLGFLINGPAGLIAGAISGGITGFIGGINSDCISK
ncbi:MAG: hypothetical protein LBV17_09055 [Treponema sp.]|jgi:hypothetical protein|nr:hypothetical protein [Treponema sp.]